MSGQHRKLRISIVEDSAAESALFASVINSCEDMCCVSEHRNTAQALKNLPEIEPDIVLVDIMMPGCSGIECVRQLRTILPAAQFLMLTKFVDDDYIFESFKAGASGYLVKSDTRRNLAEFIRQAQREGVVIPPEIARQMLAHFRASQVSTSVIKRLTPREEEVLRLIRAGLSSKEIGTRLKCSPVTVDRHAQHICEKLRVSGRTAAANKYFGSQT